MRCAEPPLMGDKLQTGFEQGTKCSSAGCAFLSSSECLASPVGLYMVALAFTSMKVSGYLFFEAIPVPLLLAGGCVFLGLWPRKGCGCFLSQDFAQISMPLPLSPLCLPSTSQVCSALFSSLSLSPKPSISRYPKSPYLGTELLCDFIWCFMSLSLWKEAQFSGFRVQERSFKDSIPLFFVFFFHQLSCVCPHLTHLACHPGPKELRDLVQMMGSQRLKHIMVSFMLYWGHPQGCEALCRVPCEKSEALSKGPMWKVGYRLLLWLLNQA